MHRAAIATQGIFTKFKFHAFHFKQACILFGERILWLKQNLTSWSSSSSSSVAEHWQSSDKLRDQTVTESDLRVRRVEIPRSYVCLSSLLFTSAENPIPPFSERSRIILSSPAEGTTTDKQNIGVSTCRNSCCGCFRHPEAGRKRQYLQ